MADETPKVEVPVAASTEAPPGPASTQRVRKPPDTQVVPEDRSNELGSVGVHKHGDLTVSTF